ITSGASDDNFTLSGLTYAGDTITINNFLQGAGNDKLTYTDIDVYTGEFATDALAQASFVALAANAAFSLASQNLFVDLNKDGAFTAADLTIHLAGVTNLTSGVDIIV